MFKVNEFLKKINKVFVYTVFLISGQGYTPDLQLLVFRPLKTLFYVCLPVPTTTQSYTHVILVLVKGSRKKKVPLLMARPLRGEGGLKARPLRKKNHSSGPATSGGTFFLRLPLSNYGHITLKFVGRYFYLVVKIFKKK